MKVRFFLLVMLFLQAACTHKSDNKKYMRSVSKTSNMVPSTGKGEGAGIPEFNWYDEKGKLLSFKEMAKGKVVVVNYWATWCIPCKRNLVALRKIRNQIDEKDLLVIGVATYETTEPAYLLDFVSKFVTERDFGYQVLLDDDKASLWTSFGLDPGAVPTTIFINREGKVASSRTGALDEEVMLQEIKKLQL